MIEAVAAGTDRAAEAKKLAAAAQDFESLFVQSLLKSMRAGIPKCDLLGGGRGEDVFTGLLDQQLGDLTARRAGGLGLGKMILKQYASRVGDAPPGGRIDLRTP